jgi:RNA polymerase sigma-70 factor (ECF subfamily)
MGRRDDSLEALDAATPAFRRYARALAAGAPAVFADALVLEALEDVVRRIRARELRPASGEDARIAVYAALTASANRKLRGHGETAPSARHPAIVHGLASLAFDDRAALLLVALEGFGYDAAAQMLGATRETALVRLMRARAALLGCDQRPSGARRAGTHPHLRVVK